MAGIAGYLSPGRPIATLSGLASMLRGILPRGPEQAALVAVDRRRGPLRELVVAPGSGAMDDALLAACPHELGLAQCGSATGDAGGSAAQPLWNETRSLVLVCDADVYNHPELRAELGKQGHALRTDSDAELLLRAFEAWDVEAFPRLNGAFALALYDLRRRRLVLARDRAGERPLYLGSSAGALCFASEIRAILTVAGAEAFPVDEGAVCDFVLHGSRGPRGATFRTGIRGLAAASVAEVGDELAVRPVRYWRLPERRLEEREIDLREACEVVRDVLADAVRLRLRGPAPAAMELSGGLASASLVALRAASDEGARFRCYTASCREAGSGEASQARLVGARWPRQVDAHAVRMAPLELCEAGEALRLAGEPIDSPRLLAAHALRRRIRADGARAVLAGTGGSLVLAGDPREYAVPFLATLLRTGTPLDVARELAAATKAQRLALARRLLPGARGGLAAHPDLAALVSAPGGPDRRSPRDFDELLSSRAAWEIERRVAGEDPARLGAGLELRVPFLDYRVAELAAQLPVTYLIRRGFGNHALRRALEPLLPLPVVWRREPDRRGVAWSGWMAAAKPWILANAEGSSLACVRASDLAVRYDALAAADPRGLWRLASVLLWHRRCNEDRPLALPASRA